MTFEKANNMIDDISWSYGGKSITKDDMIACREICHEALEKQIPKEPIIWEYKTPESPIPNDAWGYECPCCGNQDIDYPEHHCPCGQTLDWSDLE